MHLHGRPLNILLRRRGQASAADTTRQTMISGESRCIAPDAEIRGGAHAFREDASTSNASL